MRNSITLMLSLLTMLLLMVKAEASPDQAPDQHSLRHGVLDTGKLSKAGRVTVKQHALFVYGTASYGLTDTLEIEVGGSLGFAAHARARVALFPKEKPLRIALGVSGSVLNSFGEGAIWLPAAHITAGYRLGKLDVFAHTSLGRAHASQRRLYESHIGAGFTLNKNLELVAAVAELGSFVKETCQRKKPRTAKTCVNLRNQWAAQAGIKIALGPKRDKTTEVELLLVFLPMETSDNLVLPIVSFAHRW